MADISTSRQRTQQVVFDILACLLKVPEVTAADNFFELGGDSLEAYDVVQEVEQKLGVTIYISDVLEKPSVADLIDLVEQHGPTTPSAVVAPVRQRSCSPLQEQMWLHQQLADNAGITNMVFSVRLAGSLDVPVLAESLRQLERNHRALRTRLRFDDDTLTAVVAEPSDRPLPIVDLPTDHTDGGDSLDDMVSAAAQDMGRWAIDIETESAWRYQLLRHEGRPHFLLLMFNNIMVDGYSVQVLLNVLADDYSTRLSAPASPDTGVPPDETMLTPPADPGHLDFWSRMLAGAPPATILAGLVAVDDGADYRGWATDVLLDQVDAATLRELAGRHHATLQMAVMSCVVRAVALLTGSPDVTLGVPLSRRGLDVPMTAIGLFASELPVRSVLRDPGSPRVCLDDVSEVMTQVLRHGKVEPGSVVELVRTQRPGHHGTPYLVEFGWWDAHFAPPEFRGLESSWRLEFSGMSESALMIQLGDHDGKIRGRLRGRRSLLGEFDVSEFVDVLRGCVTDLHRALVAEQTADRLPDEAGSAIIDTLGGIWCDVLGRTDIGPDANFFASGGDSMAAMKVVLRTRRSLGTPMSLRDIFAKPRLCDLAELLATRRQAE